MHRKTLSTITILFRWHQLNHQKFQSKQCPSLPRKPAGFILCPSTILMQKLLWFTTMLYSETWLNTHLNKEVTSLLQPNTNFPITDCIIDIDVQCSHLPNQANVACHGPRVTKLALRQVSLYRYKILLFGFLDLHSQWQVCTHMHGLLHCSMVCLLLAPNRTCIHDIQYTLLFRSSEGHWHDRILSNHTDMLAQNTLPHPTQVEVVVVRAIAKHSQFWVKANKM